MNGPDFLQGLGFGGALLMALAAVLTGMLARLFPGMAGLRWWAAACLLGLAGALPAAFGADGVLVRRSGEAMQLLALGGIAEGLLRFGGRRGVAGGWAVPAGLYLLLASGWPSGAQVSAASFAAALSWGLLGGVAALQARRVLPALHGAVAGCAGTAAAGWLLHAGWLQEGRGAGLPDVLASWLDFLAWGVLLLLLVLAVALRLAEQLSRESIVDPLTGALNRRGFEQRTARLAALSAQLGQSVVVLMLDIDHFKQVNERHGRRVGDLALKSLTQLVQRAKRESDAFARLGGEEFCIVLPGTDVPGARVFADRLRRSFEAFEIDTGRSFLSCTVSIGVAYASAAALQAGNVDLVDLLRQADEALYEAKRAGRNRVRFYASAEVMSSRLDSRLFASTMPNQEV